MRNLIKFLLFFSLLILASAGHSLPKQFFTLQIGTSVNDYAHAIGTDSKGNVYVAGWCEGDLGNDNHSGYTHDGFGIFLMKLSPTGERIYIKQLGDKWHDWVYSLAVDSSDNVFVAGSTRGSLPGNKQNGPITQFGGAGDAFLIKFSPDGKTQWIRQWGKTGVHDASEVWQDGFDTANAVAVDKAGNAYVVGTTGGNYDLAFNSDAYVAKFDSKGKKLWEKAIETPERDEAYGIALLPDGDIVVTGSTWGAFPNQSNSGKYDIFAIRYSADGKQKWLTQLGSKHRDLGYAVAVDKQQQIYITGFMEDDYGGNVLGGGNQDAVLISLKPTGEVAWSKFLGGKPNETGHDVGVSATGEIYVTGKAALGPGNVANWTQAAENSDCFLAKFDRTGKQLDLKSWGTDSDDEAFKLAIDKKGNVWVTGVVWGALEGFTHKGQNDIFVKMFPQGK